jgi:hypothetical protein
MVTRSSLLAAAVITLVTALSGQACVPEFDDDLALLTSPRVLAVRSEPAEVTPGQTARLSVLLAVPEGDAAPSDDDDVEWALCLARKPLTELGPVDQRCITEFGMSDELYQDLGSGSAVDAPIPSDSCQRFGPQQPVGSDGTVSGRAVDPDLSGGYHQPVVVGRDSEVVLGSVRLACGAVPLPSRELIRFNSGYRPNENPRIERLELRAGGPITELSQGFEGPGPLVAPGSRVEFGVSWPACPRSAECGDGLCTAGENQVSCAADCRDAPRGCAGAETYLWADPQRLVVEERREGIRVSWYASGGRFAEERTGRTEDEPDGSDATNWWTAPAEEGPVRLWVVLRDDRGGVAWGEYRIDVGR